MTKKENNIEKDLSYLNIVDLKAYYDSNEVVLKYYANIVFANQGYYQLDNKNILSEAQEKVNKHDRIKTRLLMELENRLENL